MPVKVQNLRRYSPKRLVVLLMALVLPVSSFLAMLPLASASAATNSTINFQARLMNAAGAIAPDGYYNIEFKIYDAASSSGSSQGSCSGDADCLWTETYYDTNGVTAGNDFRVRVANGYVNVALGSLTAFPSTIKWDQQLWITMNVGGTTQTATPTYDGEMTPRLQLTAVPYAFRAGALAGGSGSNTTVLDTGTPSGSNTLHLPAESGTLCVQNAVSCGFLTGSASDYIQNQNSTSQVANFRINGTGRADTALQSSFFDTPSTGALGLGTSNANAINIGKTSANITTTVTGLTVIKPSSGNDSATAFQVQKANGNELLTVDTTNNQILVGKASGIDGKITFNNATNSNTVSLISGVTGGTYSLILPTTAPSTSQCLATDSVTSNQLKFVSCGSSGTFLAKNATDTSSFAVTASNYLYDFTNSSSAVASSVLRVNNGTNTNSTFVATTAGNPTSGQAVLFASNTNASPTGNLLDLQSGSSPTSKFSVDAAGAVTTASTINGQTISSSANFTGTVTIQGTNALTVGTTGTNTGAILFKGSTAASGTITLIGQNNPGTRTITLPDETGTICLQSSTNCGFAPTSGSANYIQNQSASAQSANFYIQSAAAGTVGAIVQGASSQTADLFRLQAVNGEVLSKFNANGALTTNGTNNTFAGLATPAFTTASTGTTYYYEITATNAAGETVGSASLGMANNTSALAWSQVAGATGYKIYRNTSNAFGSGSLLLTTITNGTTVGYTDTGSATSAGLPPTAPTGTKLVVQSWAGQTSQVFQAQDSTGTNVFGITPAGRTYIATTQPFSNNTVLSVGTGSGSNTVIAARGTSGQTADLLQLQATNGEVLSKFDANGGLTTYGVSNTLSNLAVPAFTTASTGTTYYYEITATNAAGETVGSASLGMANNTSALAWNQVAGATGYKIYRNTDNNFTSGGAGGSSQLRTTITNGTTVTFTDTGAATGAGLPPTAPTGTGLSLQAWAGQTANVFQIQDSSANVNAAFGSTGAQLTLGRIASSGTVTQGALVLSDGTTDNFGATLNTTTLTASRILTIPNETGTICTSAATSPANCTNFAPATGSTVYATRALDNLLSVNINAALGFQNNQTANINFNGAAATTGNALNITGQAAGATANNGGQVSIQGGTGTTTGTGGTLALLGGNAAATGTNGGVSIDAGSGATSYNGTITIGSAFASTVTVGSTTLSAGTQAVNIGANNTSGSTTNVTVGSGSSATGGTTTVQGKTATNVTSGGAVTVTAGAASTFSTTSGLLTLQGNGGVTINTPASTSASTSAINILSGNASVGSNLSAGTVTIDTGTKTGSGTATVNVGNTNATAIQIGNTNTTTTVTGALTSAGGAISLNNSSNFNTSINTGTSTGSVTIGNGAAGALSLQSGSTLAIATTSFNLSTAGVVTLVGGQAGGDIITAGAATATAITVQAGASSGASSNGGSLNLNAGNATGTTSVTGGNVSIAAGNATGASGTRNGGSVTIDAGTSAAGAANNGTISLGTTNAKTVSLGNTNAGVTIEGSNAGAIAIGNGNTAHTINIGNGGSSTAQAVNIGSATNTTSTLALQGGTGASAIALTTGATGGTAGGIVIGNTTGANSQSLSIGTNATSGATNVVHIGDAATATDTVTIGSTTGAAGSTVAIQGGTTATGVGAVSIQAASAGLITIGTTNANPITLGGITTLSTLGTTNNVSYLCRNSSNQIANCSTTSTGSAFVQGGNAFGATAVLGTTDAQNLQIITGASGPNVRATFDTSNNLYLGNGTTAAAPNDFNVLGTGSTTAGTAGGALTIQGGAGASATTGSLGGAVSIFGGTAAGSGNNAGGAVTVRGGTAVNNGQGGTLTLQGGNVAAGGTNGTVTIDAGSGATTPNGTVNLGTSNASVINIGSVGSTAKATTVHIADTSGNSAQTVTIGSNGNTGNTVNIEGGTGATAIQIGNAASAHGIQIGSNATGANAILLGGTNSASTVNIEGGTAAAAIQIGNGGTAHGIQIGTGAAVQTVAIGSNNSTSTTNIQAGTGTATGDINIGDQTTAGKILDLGSNDNAGTGTVRIATGAAAQTVTVGSLNTTSTTTIQGGSGNINLNTNQTGAGTIVKTLTNNSTVAFQIQNAISSTAFVADTTPLNTLIDSGNGSFEGTISGWATKQGTTTGGTPARDTTQAYIGGASLKFALSSKVIGDGVKYTPSPALSATTYTLSFYIEQTAGTAFGTNLAVGWNNGTSDTNCTLSPSLSTQAVPGSGWARYTCSFTGSASGHIYWKETDAPATARTWFLDAVQLEQASTAKPFKDSGLSLNGVVNSPVMLQNAADSTTALQISNAAGSALFDADTLNGFIGIGTGAPTRQLDLAVNNSTVTALPLLIEQAGAGDAGLELKVPGKNFYVGIDATDGAFKIASAASANGTSNIGTQTVGGGGDSNANGTQAQAITPGSTSTISSISVYISAVAASPNNHIQVGLYSDSSGAPGALLSNSSTAVATVGWNTLSVGGVTLNSGTTYWIAMAEDGASTFATNTGAGAANSTNYDTTSAYPLPGSTGNPGAYGSTTNSHDIMSIYATLVTAGAADNFSGTPFFRLSDAGQLTLQNAINTTTAFQVQNAAGTNLIGLDTTNAILNLGASGTDALASTVNVGTSTGATQTVNLGSTGSANAAAGTLINIQGGTTASTAVKIGTNGAGGITMDTGTTGSILIGAGTSNNAKTITIGPTATKTSTTTIQIGVNTAGTEAISLGSTGSANAAAGTTINVQGGTTANTAVTIGTNGAGGITIDSGTTGNILIGAGTGNNAKTITVGPTATKTSTTTLQLGINTAGTETIQLGSAGSGDAAAGTTVNVQGGTTANTAVTIGTNGAGGITMDTGTTGNILIGAGTSNNAKTITLGPTATKTSTTTLQLGINTAGTETIQLGSAGSGDAAAGTTVNIQGGTTASTAVTIGTNGAGGITMDTGTTGSILIGAGTSNNAKTITLGPTATKTSATTLQLGINTAGTETINVGSAGSGDAAAGTTVNIQAGTTASTALTLGTNGAGGITMDTGTTGSILIGAGTSNNAKTITIGPTATKTSATTFKIGVNTAGTETIQLGSAGTGDAAAGTSVNIQGGTTADTAVVIGTNGAGGITIDSGTTGNVHIGDGANAKTVTVGNTTGASTLNLQSGTGHINLQAAGTGTTDRIQIGAGGGGSTTPDYLALDVKSTTGDPAAAGAGGYMYYNNADNKFRCYQNGGWTDCIGVSAGTAFIQNGNAFGATAVLGTTDGNNLQFKTNGTIRATFDQSNNLYLGNGTSAASPNDFVVLGTTSTTAATVGGAIKIQGGTGGSTATGGAVTIQGGTAGGGNTNGANLNLNGGSPAGTGANGLVVINTPTFQTASTQSCGSNCTMTQANVDSNGAVVINATAASLTVTMPDPTVTTAGRIVYVTAANGSNDFTLSVNGGGTGNLIAMRANTTATMIWNGNDWTAAGASSSTTLQAAYNNTLTSAGGAELIVSNGSNANGLTVRDSLTSPISGTGIGTLLEVQTAQAASLLSVNSSVTDYANNGGAESTFGSEWAAIPSSGATITRNTSATYIATGAGSVSIATTGSANQGAANTLNATLTANLRYNVSFATKLTAGSAAFTDLDVEFSKDGTTTAMTACTNYSTQTVATSVWSKVNCTFTAPSSGITSSDAIFIRQTAGATRTFYIDNLSVTISADLNYATDGSVDDNTNFGTNWPAVAGTGATVTAIRSTTNGNDTSDSAEAHITVGGSGGNNGIRNKLSINPLTSTLYRISVYASSSTSMTDFTVRYSRDGGTNFDSCVDYNSQSLSGTFTTFKQITCYVTTSSTAPTNPYVYFTESGTGVRDIYVDTFTMTLASNAVPNVQIGGGVYGGPTTLLTLDRAASAPIAANNDALLGSMYYDTTLGKLQCYESDGWGACGSSPDNIITISPEYTNAVLHGPSGGGATGVGTMTSDFCSDFLDINDATHGTSVCGTNETYNFYKWTSPQVTAQTYAIYVTYQLPTTFKSFASGSTSIKARTDSSNSTVAYKVFRNAGSGSGLTQCGSSVTVSTGSVASWQAGLATGTADPSTCSFVGGDSILFEIDMTASSSANAYVSNLGFTFSNK